MQKAQYSPPWANTSIIGVAGSSGSGKTSLALALVAALNLPWVVIMSMDSFYRPLTPEQSRKAFANEYDFDSPDAIDFDVLVDRLSDLKAGKRAEIPIYSFEKHARLEKTHVIYSPHVLILEGIFALHDPRVLAMLDMKTLQQTFASQGDVRFDAARKHEKANETLVVVRDVRERGRDIEGCIKQWFTFVKPNFHRYVERQRDVADLIIPRGIENKVAISIVTDHIQKTLDHKSKIHQDELMQLGKSSEYAPLTSNVIFLEESVQVRGVNTIILDPKTDRENFIFYFDRMAAILIEKACENLSFTSLTITAPREHIYDGLGMEGVVSAVVLLRGGSIMEPALRRVLPDCITGRILIQRNYHTTEPELHFLRLAKDIAEHSRVLVLDVQMSSGGAALMAVRVLVDHGVAEERIIFVTHFAGRQGLGRLMVVYPNIKVVVCRVGQDMEERWAEAKYLGC